LTLAGLLTLLWLAATPRGNTEPRRA